MQTPFKPAGNGAEIPSQTIVLHSIITFTIHVVFSICNPIGHYHVKNPPSLCFCFLLAMQMRCVVQHIHEKSQAGHRKWKSTASLKPVMSVQHVTPGECADGVTITPNPEL